MDWTQILSIVAGFVGGGGVVTLATLRSTRKKANAEADGTAVEALNNAIETLKALDDDKDNEIADLKKENADLREANNQLQTHIADLRCECTTKGYYMCVHQGCIVRRPTLGRGKTYFTEHGKDVDFGADYTPIEELIAEHKRTRGEQ